MGNAVRLAAEDALSKVEALAAELGVAPGSNLPIAELFRRKYGMQAGNIVGFGSYMADYEKPDVETGLSAKISPFWGVAATGCEVEVDSETGQFRVTRMVNIADVGRAINPRLVQSQLSGAAIMQFGFTVSENMLFRDGQLTNGSLADYKIPGLLDVPRDFVNETVEAAQHDGPFGAKGAGESTTLTVSPAVGNAIADAVGVELMELPLTSEAVFRAIRAAQGAPLPDE
jgi:CO/xanthine dehydrogenase Mo-binding subunit